MEPPQKKTATSEKQSTLIHHVWAASRRSDLEWSVRAPSPLDLPTPLHVKSPTVKHPAAPHKFTSLRTPQFSIFSRYICDPEREFVSPFALAVPPCFAEACIRLFLDILYGWGRKDPPREKRRCRSASSSAHHPSPAFRWPPCIAAQHRQPLPRGWRSRAPQQRWWTFAAVLFLPSQSRGGKGEHLLSFFVHSAGLMSSVSWLAKVSAPKTPPSSMIGTTTKAIGIASAVFRALG